MTKKHLVTYVVLSLAGAIIAVATFTNAVDDILSLYDKHVAVRADAKLPRITMFAGSLTPDAVEFSIANASAEHSVEITSIKTLPITTVDSCRSCSFQARMPLTFKLEPRSSGFKTSTASAGDPYNPTETIIFGSQGVYHLKPGETAPFLLQIPGNPDRGLIFKLEITYNDITNRTRRTLIPDYFFYYVGVPQFEKTFEVFKFDEWLRIRAEHAREDIAYFLRGSRRDNRCIPTLAEAALSDSSTRVRMAALSTLSTYSGDEVRQTLRAALITAPDGEKVSSKEAASIRLHSAILLARLGDKSVAPLLLASWDDPDLDYRQVYDATEAYAAMPLREAADKLTALLLAIEEGKYDIRSLYFVLGTLAKTKNTAVIPVLQAYTQDQRYLAYRDQAYRGLATFTDNEDVIKFIRNEALQKNSREAISALLDLNATHVIAEIRASKDPALAEALALTEKWHEIRAK